MSLDDVERYRLARRLIVQDEHRPLEVDVVKQRGNFCASELSCALRAKVEVIEQVNQRFNDGSLSMISLYGTAHLHNDS